MDVESPAQLGSALRARRKQLRLTQLDLAELSGVSVRFVRDLERGKPTVQLALVMTITRTLGGRLGVSLPEREQ